MDPMDEVTEKMVIIFVQGVEKGPVSGRDCGWAFVAPISTRPLRVYAHGDTFEGGTKIQAVMTAAVEGLLWAERSGYKSVILVTENDFLLNGINNRWVQGWYRRNWRTATGTQVASVEQWKKIHEVMQRGVQLSATLALGARKQEVGGAVWAAVDDYANVAAEHGQRGKPLKEDWANKLWEKTHAVSAADH